MSKTNLTPANAYTYGGNLAMSLPDNPICTAEDYWNLPEGERAELIDGQLYALASPSRIHQEIIIELTYHFQHYIKSNKGNCKIYAAPFAVNLNANDQTFVEPDISVICDSNKLDDSGCKGAPDWVIEIVSPASKQMDYYTKLFKYRIAGIREYWIVDPSKNLVVVYNFELGETEQYTLQDSIKVGIYDELVIDFGSIEL